MSEIVQYEFDKLQMFFGDDYVVTDNIKVRQPSIGDILTFGEKRFYRMLSPFIANPTSQRVGLWKAGIDWTAITDYELFYQTLIQKLPKPEETSLLFGDLDFSEFKLYKDKSVLDNNVVFMYNEKQNVMINEEIYNHLCCYLRTMFNIFPKVEKAKGRTTKEWMIEEEIRNEVNKPPSESQLLSMVSFCLNHPGFKYKKEELKNMGIVEFNDSVQRLLVYESTSSLMKGMYSGFVDTSKIDKKEFNFMREFRS